VDRARPHDHQQAVVGAVKDAVDVLARFIGRVGGLLAQREFAQQMRRRREFLDFLDPQIVSPVQHFYPIFP